MQQAIGSTGAMALAHVSPFRIGDVDVRPALRQVKRGERELTLEPRVMQVLVALAGARGRVVSRDDLIASCWGGRVVGENAIARTILQLRRLNVELGTEALAIETIAKVGYRMTGEPPVGLPTEIDEGVAVAETAPASPPRKAAISRRTEIAVLIVVGMALALAAFATARWFWRGNDLPRVAVIEQSEAAAPLARDLAADLARLASARAGNLAIIDAASAPSADYVVRVTTERVGNRLRANLSLVARGDSELLWSTAVQRANSEAVDLRQQLAAKAGHVILCAIGARNGQRLDRPTLRLYLAACDRIGEPVDDRRVALLRQVVQRAPGFAEGWAELALAEAELGDFSGTFGVPESAREQGLRRAAREHIDRARAIDPNLGAIYAAEFVLAGRHRIQDTIAMLERGIAVDPDYAPLHALQARSLQSLGYMDDAIASARRAATLDPLSPDHRSLLVSALAYAGQTAQARRELDEAERIWPHSLTMREVRFRFHLRYGDPAEALRMFERGEVREGDANSPHVGRLFLAARSDPSPANVEAVLAAGRRFFARNPGSVIPHVQLLGHFDRIDEAYAVLDTWAATAPLRYGADILFRPQMRGIRRDPRFMPLMVRLGLVAYWQRADRWPGFCGDPGLQYRCREEAQRLLYDRPS